MSDGPVIVLVTSGKHEDVMRATVRMFPDQESAIRFRNATNTDIRTKYWTQAQIVDEGEEIELSQPEWFDE